MKAENRSIDIVRTAINTGISMACVKQKCQIDINYYQFDICDIKHLLKII